MDIADRSRALLGEGLDFGLILGSNDAIARLPVKAHKNMGQMIFDFFQLFTDIPINIWPWLLLMSAPLFVFSAKPHHSVQWRIGRIFLAVAVGYVLINLTLHTHRALQWKEYEQCQQEMIEGGENPYSFDPCGHHVNIADGASNVFYLVLGWIPAGGYVGFWELWWRRKYAFIIRPLGKRYKGKMVQHIRGGWSHACVAVYVGNSTILGFYAHLLSYSCFH